MKRILFAAAALVAVLFSAPPSKAVDVSVDFFYDNMSGGSWMEVGDYGYVWQPDVAVSDSAWRPYADGYWAYTDLGWTWVSYEDFGWATYHYGRWARLADYGWVWVPGRDEDLEWAPAWVSWRTGGEYIGWAPLPPRSVGVVYEGRPLGGDIDIQFDIGPACYNFVDVRYIGEPVLRERIVDYRQNVTYINQTVNVTNITYKNKIVYNYGPDINVINTRATRPIQRLKIERQENVDVAAAAKSGGLMKPQGDKLMVSAPMRIKKSGKQVAPPQVKTKVAKANFDRGWSVVGDEKAQNDFKQQMKTQQGRKAEVLSKMGANTKAGAQTSATSPDAAAGASVSAEAGASAAPVEKGKGRGRNRGAEKFEKQNAAVGATGEAGASASVVPAVSAPPNEPTVGGRGRHKDKNAEQFNANNPPAGAAETNAAAGASASVAPADQTRGGGRRGRKFEQSPQGPQGSQAQQLEQGNQNAPVDQNDRARRGRRLDQPPDAGSPLPSNPPNQVGQGVERRGERGNRFEGVGQGEAPAQSPGQVQGKHEGRGKNKPEASPSVTPQ
jgi:hypothetical protein